MKVNQLYNLDARVGLKKLEPESIDCDISSPPYWSLRDYGLKGLIWDGDPNCDHIWTDHLSFNFLKEPPFCVYCGAWFGSLGLEPTFELYIKHLVDIYDQVKRVLKKSGTCWVNLGTKYLKQNLIGIPERFLIEMLNRGWFRINTIIWYKPNAMPESVKRRFTRDFEYVYVFVKNTKKYWFEQQFERSTTKFIYSRNSKKGETQEKNNPRKNWGNTREELNGYNSKYKNYEHGQTLQGFIRTDSIKKERDQSRIDAKKLFPHDKRKQQDYINHVHDHGKTSALGRNKRTVWTIPTKSNPAAHFATFPPNLVIPMIKSGCPEYLCKECGKPREKIIDNSKRINSRPGKNIGKFKSGRDNDPNKSLHNSDLSKYRQKIISKVIGYSDCGCGKGFTAGVVLDHFAGTGTTLKEAWKLGRDYIGFEISTEYCEEIAKDFLDFTKNKRLDNFIESTI